MVVVRLRQSLSVAVVLMAAVAACSTSDSDTASSEPTSITNPTLFPVETDVQQSSQQTIEATSPPSSAESLTEGEGRLIVQERDEGQMDALIEGVVAIEDGCARLDSGDETTLGLVWPVGTKWLSETNTIRTADGDEVTNGSRIRAAGGAQSSDDLSYFQDDVLGPDRLTSDRLACAEQWWVLGNEFEILDP